MSVDVVLFDLGGVVCHFRPERRLAALAAASGLAEADVHARVWGSGFDDRCDTGAVGPGDAHRELATRLGLPVDPVALGAMWALAWEPNEAVLALVERLRGRARTAILTDNGPILRAALAERLPAVAARFDRLFFSCELGACKPAPAVFRQVLARLDRPADRVLLVDDARANVAGARAAGLRAALYRDPVTLAAVLARHGVLAGD